MKRILMISLCIGVLSACGEDNSNQNETSLTPAQKIAKMTGLSQDIVLDQVHSHVNEQDMLMGAHLNQKLQHLLQHDHLERWVKQGELTHDN